MEETPTHGTDSDRALSGPEGSPESQSVSHSGVAPLQSASAVQGTQVLVAVSQAGVGALQSLRGFGVPDKRLEEMAILNGLQLKDNLPSGTLIKIISQ